MPPKTNAPDLDRVVIELRKPVTDAGVPLTQLSMREPTVGDQLKVFKMGGKTPMEQEVILFANLCEISPAAIEMLTPRDYKRLSDAYLGFTKDEDTESA